MSEQIPKQEENYPVPAASAELLPPEQVEFWADDPNAGAELMRASRPHTGERASREWERVQAILADYAAQMPLRAICKRHHVHHRTVHCLVQLHSGTVDTLKQRARASMQRVVAAGLERLEMEIHTLPAQQLGVVVGILSDKIVALETGGGAEEPDQKGPRTSVDELAARLAAMRRAQVIEVRSSPPTDAQSDGKSPEAQ